VRNTHLLTLRIDENNYLFWNWGRDLPQPIFSDSASGIPETPYINFRSLRTIISEYVNKYPRLSIMIVPHARSDYRVLDGVFDVIDLVEYEVNRERAAALNMILDSLPRDKKFARRYGFDFWRKFDDRIIAKIRSDSSMVFFDFTPVADSMTFKHKYEGGNWESRRKDMMVYDPPPIKAPKVGIPTPIPDPEPDVDPWR